MVDFDNSAATSHPEPARAPFRWKNLISFPAALGVLMAGGIFVPMRKFWVDPDVWWHLKVGATILATHRLPATDPYSFTAHGTPWIAYEWLGDVLMAAVERAGGSQGLVLYGFLLATAILLLLYALTTQRCGNCKAAFVTCALLSPLVYPSCSLRPQMLGYLFLVLTLLILERNRRAPSRALWLLPLIFWLWVNVHGSFSLGLLALVVYWSAGLVEIHWGGLFSREWTPAERLRLELAGLASLVAMVITPYGAQLLLYPLNMAFGQPLNLANIQEWGPMTFSDVFGKLFLALVLAFLLAQVVVRPSWRLEEFVLFFLGVAGACIHLRFVIIFVPFCASLLAVVAAHWVPPYVPERDKHALNALIMAAVLAGIIGFFPSRARLDDITRENWPVRAVAYLRQHPVPQPMFNSYGFGGYLIWQLSGTNRVFIDGRADLYERSGAFADYLIMARLGPAAPFLLKAYNIQSCLLEPKETLATLLNVLPDWQRVYTDNVSILYVRRATAAEPR